MKKYPINSALIFAIANGFLQNQEEVPQEKRKTPDHIIKKLSARSSEKKKLKAQKRYNSYRRSLLQNPCLSIGNDNYGQDKNNI